MRDDRDERPRLMRTLDSYLAQLCQRRTRADGLLVEELSRRTGQKLRPWALDILAALESGPLFQSQLANEVRATRSTISKRVTEMVRDGLVERRPSDANSGRVLVGLTILGRQAARTDQDLRGEWLERVFVDCGAEDLGPPCLALWQLLERMRQAENR